LQAFFKNFYFTKKTAAKHLDINAIGIEKEEEYYNISKARIENG
jgi:DNA modification methylase